MLYDNEDKMTAHIQNSVLNVFMFHFLFCLNLTNTSCKEEIVMYVCM